MLKHWGLDPEPVFRLLLSAAKHTHPFNGPFSGTTQVSRYQKDKTNLDFTEARDSERQWHQLGKSAPRSRQITMPAPHHSVFYSRMPFLPPNQQRQNVTKSGAFTSKDRKKSFSGCLVGVSAWQCCRFSAGYGTMCTIARLYSTFTSERSTTQANARRPALSCVALRSDVSRNVRRILVRGVNAPLPPEAKKFLKIWLRNGAFWSISE